MTSGTDFRLTLVNNLMLGVRDLATSLAFYRDKLGLTVKFEIPGFAFLDAGPLTVGQLSDHLCISDSSTSTLVVGLGKGGYVTRTRSEQDQRVVHVDVTDAGRECVKEIPLGGIPLLREVLKALPAEQLAEVRDTLTLLTDLLRIDDDH